MRKCYPIVRESYQVFRLSVSASCVYRKFRLSVFHSDVFGFLIAFMVKVKGVLMILFVLSKKLFFGITTSMAANSRCRRMMEKIKMIVVQYLLLKMSVGLIRDKLQHKHNS